MLILVHELGHFVAAKIFKLRVDEFGFGLPPRAWGKRIGDTIYSINWLPFGGFVKIYGEDSPESYPNTTKGYKREEKIVEKELSYKINGVLFEIRHELDRFAREKQYATLLEKKLKEKGIKYEREKKVGDAGDIIDFLIEDRVVIELKAKPALLREDYNQIKRYLNITNTELGLLVNFRDRYLKPKRILNSNVRSISAVSDEFVDSDRDRSFATQRPWKRSLIILAGVLMNFILGWLLISVVFMIGEKAGVYITKIESGSPAYIAGIKLGDRLMGYESAEEFIVFINGRRGEEVPLTVEREGKVLKFSASPRVNPPPKEGALGIALGEAMGRLGLFPALYQGFITTAELIGFIMIALTKLIGGLITQSADLSGITGPIGIFKIAEGAGVQGLATFLNFFALISINLGVINIIPFPALDGGRFLFILIEKIKGSPLPIKFERIVNGIGFAVLISLMILITFRDVQNIIM